MCVRIGPKLTITIVARPLALSVPAFPQGVPTLTELGYAGVELETWFGLVAPAGTPDPVIRSLNEKFIKAARSPDIVQQMEERGVNILTSTPAEFTALIKDDIVKLTPILKEAEASAPRQRDQTVAAATTSCFGWSGRMSSARKAAMIPVMPAMRKASKYWPWSVRIIPARKAALAAPI
jgi:hypothetical protein